MRKNMPIALFPVLKLPVRSAILSLVLLTSVYAQTGQQWQVVEITLTSSKTYTNPSQDVDVSATFNGPGSTMITRPAFWDGGNVWKVRFAPTLVGTWNYSTVCTDASNSGLHQQSGVIQVSAYSGNLAIYKKGFIKISPTKRYMVYNDGTPFFWLGDTHWQMPDYERDNECNYGDQCGSQFKHIVRDRMQKGFTVYQTYPDAGMSDGGGNAHVANWWTTQFTQLNPAAFKQYFDPKMKYLADSGFVVALGCGVHYNSTEAVGLAGLKLLAKYLVARYGAYPVVWITAQEVDIKPEELAIWKEVAQTIDANDGYKHPLTGHMCNNNYIWGAETWHTWFAEQGGHGTTRTYRGQAFYKGFWDYVPTQPFLEAEAKYEDVDCGGLNDAVDDRVAAYKSMQCGSLGFTYGVSGVWAMKWDIGVPGWDSFSAYPWYVGVDAPGSTYLKYLKQFYTSFAWNNLVPRFGDNAWCSFSNPESAVITSTPDALRFVVYFYGAGSATGTLKNMDAAKTYIARWFDLSTGKNVLISDAINPVGSSWVIPSKPDNNDWVLLVEDVKSASVLPVGDALPISQNKTTTTSSSNTSTYSGAQSVDASPRTYWCAANGSFPQWLTVDLGNTYSLSTIQTDFYASETWKYKIEGSLSGTGNWTMLTDKTGTGSDGYRMNDIVTGNFRYVRITVTASSKDWAAIRDFKVFEKQTVFVSDPAPSSAAGITQAKSLGMTMNNTQIVFRVACPGTYTLRVFDAAGKTHAIYRGHDQGRFMLIGKRAGGVYFAQLTSANGSFIQKIAAF